jgi:hypothetical protein
MLDKRFGRSVFFLAAITGPLLAQGGKETSDAERRTESVPDLIAQIAAKEAAVRSVALRMKSRSHVPGAPPFETEGSIRVLGTTHFHVTMLARFGDGMEGRHEVVRTPAGAWTREVDPVEGEVCTFMEPELMEKLAAASKVLGHDAGMGGVPSQSEAPLGSAMLRSLSERFDLAVKRRIVVGGIDHIVIEGSAKPGVPMEEDMPVPDHVEVLVREVPLGVARMIQFKDGKELLSLTIEDVQIDAPMAEESFTLDADGKTRFIDVMKHPPAAEQIKAVLAEAESKREAAAKGRDGAPGGAKR